MRHSISPPTNSTTIHHNTILKLFSKSSICGVRFSQSSDRWLTVCRTSQHERYIFLLIPAIWHRHVGRPRLHDWAKQRQQNEIICKLCVYRCRYGHQSKTPAENKYIYKYKCTNAVLLQDSLWSDNITNLIYSSRTALSHFPLAHYSIYLWSR